MSSDLKERLRQVEKLSAEMVALADAGDATGSSLECGILFGTLRDCGYKLRQLAQQELSKRDARTRGRETPTPAPPGSARVHPDEVSPSATPEPNALSKRVLIVDDDPDVVTYLETWFGDLGFEVHAAVDGVEALERARELEPDLITLDMSMPEKSGVKVFQQLKGSARLRHIPVIIITAIGEPMHTFLSGRRQVPGPEGFLAKPMDLYELARLVRKLVGNGSAIAPGQAL